MYVAAMSEARSASGEDDGDEEYREDIRRIIDEDREILDELA
jgi:hypothetical protein